MSWDRTPAKGGRWLEVDTWKSVSPPVLPAVPGRLGGVGVGLWKTGYTRGLEVVDRAAPAG